MADRRRAPPQEDGLATDLDSGTVLGVSGQSRAYHARHVLDVGGVTTDRAVTEDDTLQAPKYVVG